MAVPHPGLWEKSAASIGRNGSTSSGDFSEIEATIHRLCDARSDDDGNRAAARQKLSFLTDTADVTAGHERPAGYLAWTMRF